MTPRILAQLSCLFMAEHLALRARYPRQVVPIEVARLGAMGVELESEARRRGWRGDPRDAFDELCHSPGRDYDQNTQDTGSDPPAGSRAR